jgi:hypothetical protein
MERKLNILLGMIASLLLIFLNTIPTYHIPFVGIFQFILPLGSLAGFICAIYFSFNLIIDAIKLINNKK